MEGEKVPSEGSVVAFWATDFWADKKFTTMKKKKTDQKQENGEEIDGFVLIVLIFFPLTLSLHVHENMKKL